MTQRFRAGDHYLEIPGSSTIAVNPAAAQVKAEKPETPDALEETQYIYRPNDPFQSGIDEARAITSISASHKPWVRKTWFILFVIGPLVVAELFTLALMLGNDGMHPLRAFFAANAGILPLWLIYYTIWQKKMKS